MAIPYKDRDPHKAATPQLKYKILRAKLISRYEDVHGREPDALMVDLIENLATLIIAAGRLRATFLRSVAEGCPQDWTRQYNQTLDKITKLDAFLFPTANPTKGGAASTESDWSEMVTNE